MVVQAQVVPSTDPIDMDRELVMELETTTMMTISRRPSIEVATEKEKTDLRASCASLRQVLARVVACQEAEATCACEEAAVTTSEAISVAEK